jgi:predicted dehydrogenase
VTRVKIIGAGSIGNHHAHAARRLGWQVVVCDADAAALARMREQIYPSRYGEWDKDIVLCHVDEAPRAGFSLIIIGTPPDSHVPLALAAIDENPEGVLIEKPLAPPSLAGVGELVAKAASRQTRVFVGYDHVVGRAAEMVREELARGTVGDIQTLDVEFREHWAGIFGAHPWLSGPADSYLGYWRRGGGASGEHSHALNLWQHFATACGAGPLAAVQATIDYVAEGAMSYDRLCLMHLVTQRGLVGRVAQDVVTIPARKWACLQGTRGAIEWIVGYRPGEDAIIMRRPGEPDDVRTIAKTRPDDFIQELEHVAECLRTGAPSPLDLAHGVDTIRAVAAAHDSARSGQRISLEPAAAAAAIRT